MVKPFCQTIMVQILSVGILLLHQSMGAEVEATTTAQYNISEKDIEIIEWTLIG